MTASPQTTSPWSSLAVPVTAGPTRMACVRPRDLAPTSSEEKLNENTIEVFADIGETEIPIAACYACGNTVPISRRIRTSVGWLCAGCLWSEAYARGQAAGRAVA